MPQIIKIISFVFFILLIVNIAVSNDKSVIHYQVIHIPSLVLVFGGTILLILSTNHYTDIFSLLKRGFSKNSLEKKEALDELKKDIVEITDTYYRSGASGLLKEKNFKNKNLNEILEHIDSKIPIGDISRNLLRSVKKDLFELNRSQIILKLGKSEAPALGMFGTILGLVKLLDDLSDLASLGPNMSLALITTLYGVFFSFILGILISTLEERKKNIQRSYGLLESWLKTIENKKPSLYLDKEMKNG